LISPSSGKESSSLASWVKGEVTMPVVMEKPVEATSVEATSVEATSVEATSVEATSVEVAPVEKKKPTKAKKAKKANKAKKVVVKEPEPEPEVDIDEDSESEDEELDVEEFEHKGKTYYKDDNGIIYDPDTEQKIGVYESEDDSIRFYE